ncbi:unnamed protein product [Vitrella brassicaformis CCMP3155]|uniref:PUB domain-containing protein n=1 Tax=Vitrella brassicaformis (strain CCMP3155) TaxID=1169540 RepID=A0A0G4FRN7_VITBC|nr:unnamed protein product [Vitrella brassicaformis CCMP3155]|eukprot:CEM17313.1 unnamed protein product [Vitrella brassicaformis CCMP3155]
MDPAELIQGDTQPHMDVAAVYQTEPEDAIEAMEVQISRAATALNTIALLEERQECAATLARLHGNLLKHPRSKKYRSFKTSNPKIQETIMRHLAACQLLEAVGWTRRINDDGQEEMAIDGRWVKDALALDRIWLAHTMLLRLLPEEEGEEHPHDRSPSPCPTDASTRSSSSSDGTPPTTARRSRMTLMTLSGRDFLLRECHRQEQQNQLSAIRSERQQLYTADARSV